MEPVHKVLFNNIKQKTKEAFQLSKDMQRFLWYTHKLPQKDTWTVVHYSEFDERIILSQTTLELRMASGHLFPQRKDRKGFTFDKQTNKLSMWYGTTPQALTNLGDFLREVKREWVVNENFLPWMTKGLLEKILANKITNPSDAVNYIIKSQRLKGIEPVLLKKYIKDQRSKKALLSLYGIIENVNDIIRLGLDENIHYASSTLRDLLKQARILGRKIKYGWSEKRIQQTHADWTKEIMAIEMDLINDEHVEYKNDFQSLLPENFELIRDKKRMFIEGQQMAHCIYTNYWNDVKDKKYMVFHIKQLDNSNPVTAGISIYVKNIPGLSLSYYAVVDQIYGKRNQIKPTEKTKAQVQAVITSPEFFEMLNDEFKKEEGLTTKIRPLEEAVNLWEEPADIPF